MGKKEKEKAMTAKEKQIRHQLITLVEALSEYGYRGIPCKGLHKLLNKIESELGTSKKLLRDTGGVDNPTPCAVCGELHILEVRSKQCQRSLNP